LFKGTASAVPIKPRRRRFRSAEGQSEGVAETTELPSSTRHKVQSFIPLQIKIDQHYEQLTKLSITKP
jgi:hypothetical protein